MHKKTPSEEGVFPKSNVERSIEKTLRLEKTSHLNSSFCA